MPCALKPIPYEPRGAHHLPLPRHAVTVVPAITLLSGPRFNICIEVVRSGIEIFELTSHHYCCVSAPKKERNGIKSKCPYYMKS